MTNTEFVAKALEMLDSGRVEINGEWYYNQESVLTTLEWFRQLHEEHDDRKVEQILERIKSMIPQFTYFPPE